jgi:hypothetical protein
LYNKKLTIKNINNFMNHLTNLYKHKCEQLQEQINNMKRMLSEAAVPTPTQVTPTQVTPSVVPPSGIDPRMFDPRLIPSYEKPRQPEKPYEQELFDIIEWMLQQLNLNCDPGNPCATDEEIAAMREKLRRIANELARGFYGLNKKDALQRLYNEFMQLIKRTRLWKK